jgi:lysophospholipase L1-like esterase
MHGVRIPYRCCDPVTHRGIRPTIRPVAQAAARATIGVAARAAMAVAAVVGVTVVVTGCGIFDEREPVAVIGDSITWQSAGSINNELGDQWRLDVRGVPGATIAEMVETAAAMASRSPQQVVVNLGTNDVARAVPPEQSAADLERLLDQFSGTPCIHLVTVHNNIFDFGEGFISERAQATNLALGDVAVRRGVNVIDWNLVLAERLAVPGSPGLLSDTVHPTPAGVEVLVDMYGDALTRGCPQP